MNEDNKIFKTNEISIEISPVKNTVDSQRAQYYSYDENSGLQRIRILKDGQPLGLPEGSQVRLSAVKLSGSKQMMIYTPEIEDRVNGIVTFVIPKEFIGYSGQIRCTLYIDFSSDQTLHAGYFYINMGISDIDANLPEFSDSYWQRWADFEAEATAKMQELEQRIDEQTEIFNNADVYNKAEIEDKLEPFALRTDIDSLSIEKADKVALALTDSKVADLDSVKADKAAVLADSNKFRTDIAEVSAQLAETDEGVNAVNLRVDNLVIPLSPENTNIEVTDAHNSIVKNKNFSSLKERLEESEGELVQYRLDYATLESNIDVIVPNINVKNLMRGTILTSGQYIVPNTGAMSNNSTYSSSDFIEISPSVAYELYIEKQCYGAWYDSDNIFISGLSSNTTGALTLDIVSPANAKFIRISGNTSEINKFTLKIKDTEALFLNPLINVSDSQILKSSTAKVLKVKPLGGGDFTTLRSAFESITDSSPTNRYVVEFYGDGTEYNVADEYPSLVGMVGLMIPSYTKLVGVGGKTKNILVARLAEPNANFSTLNMRSSAEIEGIKVIGYNTRYAVHDDFFNTVDINSSRIIKDCEFISEKTYYGRAWGAGIRSGCKWKFENCKFVGLYGTNETAYSCHNNVDFDAETEQIFENCRFIGTYTGHKVRFGSITKNANGILNNVIFKGCKIGHLRLNEENAGVSGTGILFKVSGYANDITSAEIINTDEIDYTSYVDLI